MSAAQQQAAGIETLPLTLQEAIGELKKDELVQRVLGPHTSGRYIEAQLAQWHEYTSQVTAWELNNYLYKI